MGAWGQRRLINIVFLIVINLFLGFTQAWIDNLAHMGGLAAGLVLGWALAPRYEVAALPPQSDRPSSRFTTDGSPARFPWPGNVQVRLVDRNSLARYWPALAAAVLLFVGGTVLVTQVQQ